MKRILLPLIISIVLFGCKDEDIVSNRVIFSISLREPLFFSKEVWIVLRDDDTGELIDSRMLDKTKPNVFESTKRIKSNKMTVSFLRTPYQTGYSFETKVFSGIDVGTEWTWTDDVRNHSDPQAPHVIGQYSLTVNNVPPMYSFIVGDKYGDIDMNVDASYNNGVVTLSPGIRAGLKQIVAIDPQVGKQKYATIIGPNINQEIVLDYNDFKEFDHYTHLNFGSPTNNAILVKGYEGTANYYNGYDFYQSNYAPIDFYKQEMNIGVLDELSVYRYTIYLGDTEYQYLGPALSEINYPTADLFVVDSSKDNFKVQGSGKYNYSVIDYEHLSDNASDPYIFVKYYSPEGVFKHFDPLTDEIADRYSLQMNKIEYKRMVVVKGTQTYSKLVDFFFAAVYDASEPYDISTVKIPLAN